jgi:hypothetical protein
MNGNDPKNAIKTISSIHLESLVLLFMVVVILTIATQAFEFEAIRLLEGYWGAGPMGRLFTGIGCGSHIKRRRHLERKMNELQSSAFAYARQQMLKKQIPASVVNAIEGEVLGTSIPDPDSDPNTLDWRESARSSDIRRLTYVIRRLDEYPTPEYRILPTRLGNTLRVSEDKLHDRMTGSMEGMLLTLFDDWPDALKNEHDRYRGRLDLYCSMVLVFVLAAIAAGAVLFKDDWRAPALAVGAALSLAVLSYRAALASARHYATVLDTAHNRVGALR